MYRLKENINRCLNSTCSFKDQVNHLDTWELLGFSEEALVHISATETDDVKEAVQIVLLNENGEVLAVSRKDNHSDFGLIGGKRDPEDESNIDAAIRETKEETGLDITNLRMIFSMHKDGFMGYTYLADYSGEIDYDKEKEPHVVKWTNFKTIMDGSFGKWNTLVAESLMSMGVKIKI